MKWQIITPPAVEPLDFNDVSMQARIDDISEQSWITGIAIPNARATCETEAQVSLITQTIAATIYNEQDASYHPLHSEIRLPRGPVQSIVSVVDGNGQTIGNDSPSIAGQTTISFTFTAGNPQVPTNLTSATLADPTDTFGVRRTDTNEVVVAADTAFSNTSTGVYTYTFTGTVPGITYEYWITRVYLGTTTRTQGFVTSKSPVDASQYELRRYGLNDFLHLKSAQKFPLTITYVAGYGDDGSAIPANIKGIMLAHAAFLYDNRSADVDPTALDRVYRKYRSFAQ